jgi:peptidoglycan lytic transglycosylase
MIPRSLALVLAALLAQPGGADLSAPVRRAPAGQHGAGPLRGYASWYGKNLQGHRTASGETFDMNALTAAHRTLPFGTRVRVRHVCNGRCVVVRINDRGPWSGKRLIDLSLAAARELGIARKGGCRVELEILGP